MDTLQLVPAEGHTGLTEWPQVEGGCLGTAGSLGCAHRRVWGAQGRVGFKSAARTPDTASTGRGSGVAKVLGADMVSLVDGWLPRGDEGEEQPRLVPVALGSQSKAGCHQEGRGLCQGGSRALWGQQEGGRAGEGAGGSS